jgi:hypothetical protein
MRCSRCDTDNTADSMFCMVCGKRLEKPAADQPPPFGTAAETAPGLPPKAGAAMVSPTFGATPARPEAPAAPAMPALPSMPASGMPISAGYTPGFGPPQSTGLAVAAAITGGIAGGLMLLAALMVGIAVVAEAAIVAGIGFILALPALLAAPFGLVLGIIALVNKLTQDRPRGRRDALVGVIGGLASFLLCCVIAFLAGQMPPIV